MDLRSLSSLQAAREGSAWVRGFAHAGERTQRLWRVSKEVTGRKAHCRHFWVARHQKADAFVAMQQSMVWAKSGRSFVGNSAWDRPSSALHDPAHLTSGPEL